jgi:hypothetical protein
MKNVNERYPRKLRILCKLANLSPQGFYQNNKKEVKEKFSQELIIQEVICYRSIHKRVGVRKLLPQVQSFAMNIGYKIGRDALFELLEIHNLLIRNRRKNGPITTFSKHRFKKYPNIIRDVIPTMPIQIWVSDITYIELGIRNYAYLSLITDMYSRKIVGFCLHKNLSSDGPLKALKMAIKSTAKDKLQSLIHHSDRGVQYCCNDYVNELVQNGIRISMTINGDPLENPIAERVNGIIKNEYELTFEDVFKTLENKITEAIFHYNNYRQHLSIDNMTPSVAHQLNGYLKRQWKTNYKNINSSNEA